METSLNLIGQNTSLIFSTSVSGLKPLANASFDRAKLLIAYHGSNNNKSFISKEDFERAIPTMFNCPVVCNYDRDTDSIGGHDVKVVADADGLPKIVNVTQPIGVVPESAEWYWEEIEEANGDKHEYLCVDVLIWKRQEAYQKIKDNGFTAESMEIKILAGSLMKEDGLFHITDFEFLAFCLLESKKPCFQSAGLEFYSACKNSGMVTEMFEDFKRDICAITSAFAADIEKQTKGGVVQLNMDELMQKYNLSAEEIDFETEGMTDEELEAKFAELNASKNTASEQNTAEEKFAADEQPDESNAEKQSEEEQTNFSLTLTQYADELRKVIQSVKAINPAHHDWGECRRYYYVDCDVEAKEVYAYDDFDNRLYGFSFAVNGDAFDIDFESAKRKKIVYADFEDGENDNVELFSAIADAHNAVTARLENSIYELNASLEQKKAEEHMAAVSEVFAQFSDLNGNELFDAVRESAASLTVEEVTEKCYAIRGRQAPVATFSAAKESVRIPIEKSERKDDEPYGGLFREFGFTK